MLNWNLPRIRLTSGVPPETRERMIRQTNAFLTLALRGKIDSPRIPRRRLDQGGFAALLRRPGGKALARRIWDRLLYES